MARLAKFDGLLKVREFRKSDGDGDLITMGSATLDGRTITIRINHNAEHVHGIGKCANYDPLTTWGHELGHIILQQRGREFSTPEYHSMSERRSDPVERACDRYSRILRDKS